MVTIDDVAFPLDPTNAEQAGEWDGDDGAYWATYHREYERLLGVFDATLLEAGAVGRDHRVLDFGCGTGATTRALAVRAAGGSVLGLDLSSPMLAIARTAADGAGLRNVEFVQGDAQVYPLDPRSFDVAVSRMGCMFFGDPAQAFANIGRALRPGGRLALTVWQTQAANEWITAIDDALGEAEPEDEEAADDVYTPGPFSLADPALCTSLLEGTGYVDVAVTALDIPLAFGTVDDARAFLETWMDEDLDAEARAQVSASLHQMLTERSTEDEVLLPSATWLVTGRRP